MACLWLLGASPSHAAEGQTERVGDVVEWAMPAIALSVSAWREDREGVKQLSMGLATNVAIAYAAKGLIKKERPDRNGDDSMPSAHTASAFHTAVYLHRRYGWRQSLPAYAAAAWVGHSRVHAERHDDKDVIAGAALGMLTGYLFTTRWQLDYRGVQIVPDLQPDYVGLRLSYVPARR